MGFTQGDSYFLHRIACYRAQSEQLRINENINELGEKSNGNYNNIMGEVGRIPQRFLQDHTGSHDRASDVSVVFGMGIQTTSHGQPYLNFLIPGVVSLTTMNGSFNAIAQNLNVQRLYEKAFDQVMISPTPLWQFIAGQIIGGSLRGLYAGGIILLLTAPIETG